MDREAILHRIDQLLGLDFSSEGGDRAGNISEAYHGARTVRPPGGDHWARGDPPSDAVLSPPDHQMKPVSTASHEEVQP